MIEDSGDERFLPPTRLVIPSLKPEQLAQFATGQITADRPPDPTDPHDRLGRCYVAGFVMSYSPSLNDMYRRAPYFVDRILRGARPADLPVEQPTKFGLVISAKSAKALGLTFPPSLLARADQIIE